VQAGAASLADGFPPLTFIPVDAGGVPPFGQDMNGILNQITRWTQWQAAGNPVQYDSTFAVAIGGYPRGAQILSNSGHAIYENLVDNNLSSPESTASNWRIVSSVWSSSTWTATGAANTQSITLAPAPTGLAQLTGIELTILSSGTNVATSPVTLSVNGLTATQIVTAGGVPLAASALLSTYPFQVIYNGSAFVLMSRTSSFYDPGQAAILISGPTGNGANIAFQGNGSTTPNKYIRAIGGRLAILNSAYTSELVTLSDSGAMTVSNALTTGSTITAANGDVVAVSGRVRAGNGATGTGDVFACPNLGDFPSVQSGSDNYLWYRLPNGIIMQAFNGSTVTGVDAILFPNAFPSICSQVLCHEAHAQGSWPSFPTVWGTEAFSRFGFNILCTRWNGSSWQAGQGIGYRYIAFGY
jgi:hypothetical protein